MGNEQENAAVESLRLIAQKADTSIKNIYALVTQAYRNDSRLKEEEIKQRSLEVQYDQLRLTKMQIANEMILNQLLSYKLRRKQRFLKFFGLLKNPKP